MIDVRDIGRDFMPRRAREREELREREFMRPDIPQTPIAPTPAEAQLPISIGQPAPFTPVMPPLPAPVAPVAPQAPQVSTGQLAPFAPVTPAPAPTAGEWTSPAPPGGEGFPYPQQWEWASEALRGLAETGMPGITPEYAEKAWLPYQRRGQQEAMQAREEAGLGGLRWSTPLAGRLEDIWGGASERFGAGMEQMRMQDIAGQRGARLGATGQLMGLGGQYAGLPLNVAQSMMGMGISAQQAQQAELDRQREEWLRQQPGYSPFLQYQAGGAQMPSGPTMYGPSFGGQMFDLSSMLGLAGQAGLFGGGGTRIGTSPLPEARSFPGLDYNIWGG